MFVRAHTFTIEGLHTRHVTVEVDIRQGLPAFTIVGLADAAVREARERVQAAIRNSGFEFPSRRITANLAPGDVRKAGPGLDLALACAVLAASEQVAPDALAHHALYGELGLDGAVKPSWGTLAVAHATERAGIPSLLLAGACAAEAQLVEGPRVLAVDSLRSAARVLAGGEGDLARAREPSLTVPLDGGPEARQVYDLAEVRGQQHAVRALVIAAAGGHNCLLSGPPGTGKTMLAGRLPSILPPLSRHEAIEVTRIQSALGRAQHVLVKTRPFRAPHHSVTAAGLIGGARAETVGEVVLAHNGVLFLDELSEFARATLDALRQPLEEGRVAIARARHRAVYPARFMLIAATNPCPCGYAGEVDRCACSEADMARHRRRLSGPLLDRIDLLVNMRREGAAELDAPSVTSSVEARGEVTLARERQDARAQDGEPTLNAHLDAAGLRRHARLDTAGEEMLRRACERGMLSARGRVRVLRVARTIADLGACERVRARDVGVALAMRPDAGVASNRLA